MLEVCMEIGIKGAVGYGVEELCVMMGRQGKYWLKPRALLYEGRGGQTWLVHRQWDPGQIWQIVKNAWMRRSRVLNRLDHGGGCRKSGYGVVKVVSMKTNFYEDEFSEQMILEEIKSL